MQSDSGRRSYRLTSAYGFVILAVLTTLGITRSMPAPTSGSHATASWDAPHPHRLSFDREVPDGIVPARTSFADPSTLFSEAAITLSDVLLPSTNEGPHYNRPPPAL